MDRLPGDWYGEWGMDYARACALRREVGLEPGLYRVVRLYQPEGSHHWAVEVERLATGERVVLRDEWEWTARLARDAGY